ncbi:MAG: Gfo/Idh/MocA family oxidoreductase [Planctomycetota bacterium]
MTQLTRRDFVKTSGAALGAAAIPGVASLAQAQGIKQAADVDQTLRVLSIGVGGIGGLDRAQVSSHPKAQIVGLVDVDTKILESVKAKNADAFTDTDYRRVFADRKDEFDAVLVSTPDHHHAPMVLTALAHDKHVYAQKPLVQQLEELQMIDTAIAAKPSLKTQTGNQRMKELGRRAAVEILRRNMLGPVREAWCWTASNRGRVVEPKMPEVKQAPEHLDWDLWLGAAPQVPYRDGMAHNNWRSWWEYGTGSLGDWGIHLLDVIFYSYPELKHPYSVKVQTPRASSWHHSGHNISTTTYLVEDSDRFSNDFFPIYFNDSRIAPSMAALGVRAERWLDGNMTVVVCEEGTLTLAAGGNIEVWQNGEMTKGWNMPGLPDLPRFNHWHAWVDACLTGGDENVWTPFEQGSRMTECCLIAAKATRFPNTELIWDRKTLTFPNKQKATDTIVRRSYRDGFGPPALS